MAEKKKKSKVLESVEEELRTNPEALKDDEFVAPPFGSALGGGMGSQRMSAPLFGRRKSPDEVAVDELLSGMKATDGWYLKLSKEVSPNEFQYKKRINEFEHWADLEQEIVDLVRAETKNEIDKTGMCRKWGSGRYMILAWNEGGLRGNKKPPRFISVDAEEWEHLPKTGFNANGQPVMLGGLGSSGSTMEQFEALSKVLSTVHQLSPSLKPEDVQKQIIDATMKGMEMAGQNKAAEATSSATMMTAMMTMMMKFMELSLGNRQQGSGDKSLDEFRNMMGYMKDLGVLPSGSSGSEERPKSFLEQYQEMKVLGLIKDPADSDPLSNIAKVKTLMSLIGDFAGAGQGERPSLMEKIIDNIGPKIPDMIKSVSENFGKIADVKKMEMMGGGMPQPTVQRLPYPVYREAPVPQAPLSPIQQEAERAQTDMFTGQDGVMGTDYGVGADMDASSMPAGFTEQDGMYRHNQQQQPYVEQPQPVHMGQQQGGQNADMMSLLMGGQVKKWADELFLYVLKKDHSKFSHITNTIGQFMGGADAVIAKAKSGTITPDMLYGWIIMFDKEHYNTRENSFLLQDYIHAYLRTVAPEAYGSVNAVVAKCNVCGAEHEFNNRGEYDAEKQQAEGGKVICGVNDCKGEITLQT